MVPEYASLVRRPTVPVYTLRGGIGESAIIPVCTCTTLQLDSEAKNYFWYMRSITDEALIQLYWACREGKGFPGAAIEEKDGQVSAHAILEALGLTTAIDDENFRKQPEPSATEPTYRVQALQHKSPTPPLTPDNSTATDTASGGNSRTNSTVDISPTIEQTRLQRQFHQQLQHPAPSPHGHGPGISTHHFPYAPTHPNAHGPYLAQPPAPSNPSLEIQQPTKPTSLALTPLEYTDSLNNLLPSQWFDFDAGGITPGWNNFGAFDLPPQPQSQLEHYEAGSLGK